MLHFCQEILWILQSQMIIVDIQEEHTLFHYVVEIHQVFKIYQRNNEL